jgi:colanic acid biosynthesis glycosyl transferase WcaI
MAARHSGPRHSPLRIVVHDFSGHPGQIQLSRELAHRGHVVEHQYCQSLTTGQGATTLRRDDPQALTIKPISLGSDFARYSPMRRLFQEVRYGWSAIRAAFSMRPDVAVFSNLPMVPLAMASVALRFRGIPYVFWWQDVYSDAIGSIARRRLKRGGGTVGWLADRVEKGCARRSAAIVPITRAFVDQLDDWGIDREKVTVIPNWGALDEVGPRPRINSWGTANHLENCKVVMYTGTLGLKHDPSVIDELARNAPDDCRVVVVSQGIGRKWLDEHCHDNPKLVLMDFQPYAQLSDMLGTADVLVAVLEKDASRYSVPSKVLNYLCAGRPVLALLPADNAVAEIVRSADAGIVVPPGEAVMASEALVRLLSDDELRARMATNARDYAARVFDIVKIGDSFEGVIYNAVAGGVSSRLSSTKSDKGGKNRNP